MIKKINPSLWEGKENPLGYTTVTEEIKESIWTSKEGSFFLFCFYSKEILSN